MTSPRPCKKPRAANATAAAATDALISLPRDVLDEILTRLELRDAVRTSALSRAWRHRWESIPSLDIHIPRGQPPLWAVDSVLLRCSGRVRAFDVDLDELSLHRLHDWLLILSRRGMEDLNLRPHVYFFPLHSTVFSCRRLVSLDLFACEIPPLPQGFEGFPDLKVLSLASVNLQENGEYQLEEIIETSPLLEKLILCEVCIAGDYFIEWEIRAPNLRHLTICSNLDYGWNFVEMPSLRSAVIDFWEYVGDRDFAEFLAAVVQVTKLRVYIHAPVNRVKILEALPCMFDNLTNLKLLVDFCESAPILSIFCFLRSAPNLEKLKILICGGENQNVEATEEFLNAQWIDGMCAKLQVLRVTEINWLPNEMSFMKFILSKVRHLRNLSVSHADKCLMSHEESLLKLQKCPRASAEAQILFKGPAGQY